jgi:integrase
VNALTCAAAFKLLQESGEVSIPPMIKLLSGENVRAGFIDKPAFDKLLDRLASDDARDIVEFLYNSAWRSREAKTLEWRDVDRDGGMVRLRAENSKNKKQRLLPLIGSLKDIIDRRYKKRRLDCPFVFHRDGKQIRSFLKTWRTACTNIGQPGLVPHDMRRSGIRNFRKAGLSESEGMMLSGHKTNSVYRRYDIIDEQDLRESMARVQEHLARQKDATVVPIKAAQ